MVQQSNLSHNYINVMFKVIAARLLASQHTSMAITILSSESRTTRSTSKCTPATNKWQQQESKVTLKLLYEYQTSEEKQLGMIKGAKNGYEHLCIIGDHPYMQNHSWRCTIRTLGSRVNPHKAKILFINLYVDHHHHNESDCSKRVTSVNIKIEKQ